MNPVGSSNPPISPQQPPITSLTLSDLPPPGLFPNDSTVTVRPPLIPRYQFKRVNTKTRPTSTGVAVTGKPKDTNKWVQPVKDIGAYVRAYNLGHEDQPQLQYRWWSEQYSDDQITHLLIGIVESKANLRIPDVMGSLTYEQACKNDPKRMEEFVIEVAFDPMFDPLTQTARAFGVRLLISAKMTSKRRTTMNRRKWELAALAKANLTARGDSVNIHNGNRPSSNEMGSNSGQMLAPQTVPDRSMHIGSEMSQGSKITHKARNLQESAKFGSSLHTASDGPSTQAQHENILHNTSLTSLPRPQMSLKRGQTQAPRLQHRKLATISPQIAAASHVRSVRINPLVPPVLRPGEHRRTPSSQSSAAQQKEKLRQVVAGNLKQGVVPNTLRKADATHAYPRMSRAADAPSESNNAFQATKPTQRKRARDLRPMHFSDTESGDGSADKPGSDADESVSDDDIAKRLAELERENEELRRITKKRKKITTDRSGKRSRR